MMKLLYLVTNADLAGAPIHLYELLRNFPNRRLQIEVIFGEDGPIRNSINELGIRTHIVEEMRSSINPWADFIAYLKVLKISRYFKPDLIHCHSSKAGLIGRLVARRLKIKLIYTVHGWGFGIGRRFIVSAFVYMTELLMKNYTTYYIAVSYADKKIGVDSLKIDPNKIHVIHNGITSKVSEEKNSVSESNLIMVARDAPQKDYKTFFKSLSLAVFDKAYVVGEGTNSKSFMEQAKIYSGNSFYKIEFMGVQSNVGRFLNNSSIFVLSSKFEGLPLSIIEAMSYGLPIIASDVGGVSELVIDNDNGFLVPSGDPFALSNKISFLSKNPCLRIRMGNKSSNYYNSQFTSLAMAKSTFEVYSLVNSLAEMNG